MVWNNTYDIRDPNDTHDRQVGQRFTCDLNNPKGRNDSVISQRLNTWDSQSVRIADAPVDSEFHLWNNVLNQTKLNDTVLYLYCIVTNLAVSFFNQIVDHVLRYGSHCLRGRDTVHTNTYICKIILKNTFRCFKWQIKISTTDQNHKRKIIAVLSKSKHLL